MGKNELIEFCGELKHETKFAYLVFDGASETWIPKSQVKSMRQIGSRGDDYEFEIPEWLARSKGII